MQKIDIDSKSSFLNQPTGSYAALQKRFFAFLIDVGIIYFKSWIIWVFIFNSKFTVVKKDTVGLILYFLFLFYFIFFQVGTKGQTFGCRVVGIRVISVSGEYPRLWQLIIRSIALALLAVPFVIGGLSIILGINILISSIILLVVSPTKDRKQTFWDAGTKTCVVNIHNKNTKG